MAKKCFMSKNAPAFYLPTKKVFEVLMKVNQASQPEKNIICFSAEMFISLH